MNKKKILLLLLIILLVGVATLYFVLLMLPPYKPPPLNVTPRMELIIFDSGVVDYGVESEAPGAQKIEQKSVVYILSQLNGKDIQDVEVKAELFADRIPKDIYLLDYSSGDFRGCVECDGLSDFRDSLEKSLKQYGLIEPEATLNQIKLYQLDTLTRPSILIVPTGKIPSQLVGVENGTDLGVLMKKGFVVIFIGSELSSSLNKDGSVQPVPSSQLRQYGIQYKPRTDLVTRAPYRLKKPAFSISELIVGGSLSVIKNENGYLLVFPRSIDIGWSSNGTQAGEDVARAIYDVAWQSPTTTATLTIPSSKINESNSNRTMIFLLPSRYSEGWARIYLTTNTTNNLPFRSVVERRITKTVSGSMYHRSKVARGEADFTIDFKLFANFSQPKDVNISVAVYDEDMRLVGKQLAQKGIRLIQGEYSFSSNFVVDFERGVYILRAEDDDGYIYAQSLLIVPQINITPSLQFWEEPQFITFKAVLSPEKRFGELPEPLKNRVISITVNSTPGKDLFKEPFLATTDSEGLFNYSRPDIYLGFGRYTFKMNISGEVIVVDVERKKPPGWFDNPINVAIGVLIVLVGGVALALRRPEKPFYTIDVPDFPPMEKVIIPLSKFSILSLFDSVNREYKWSFMPLSAQELKNEMRRKVTYKGVPIMITDYNLEKILNDLIEGGDVVKAVNLYGLKMWEEKSGRSMKYLALFRLLRSFFVNNAVPFTELNSRKDCDMFATVKGEGIYIHIYTDEGAFKRGLALVDSGKNFIVFESRKEMEEILKKLELSYTPTAVILKSEISNGRIIPIHPGNFGVMLGR